MISKRSLVVTIATISAALFTRGVTRQVNAGGPPQNRTEANAMKIYLASPLGFSEVGRAFYKDKLIPEVTRQGYQVVYPWNLTPQAEIDAIAEMPYGAARRDAWKNLNEKIGRNNRAGLDDSERVLAVLDGVDVDSGTASEIGYAFAKGKPILGYRGDFRLSADNEGSTVNLQVEYFIRQSGGDIITDFEKLGAALNKLKTARAQP